MFNRKRFRLASVPLRKVLTKVQEEDLPMKTYPMLSFRCDDKLLKQIRKEAKRRDMNTSEFIKEAVTFHLQNIAEIRTMQPQ